ALHQVLIVAASPVVQTPISKRLPVARTPPGVQIQHPVASSRVDLIRHVERVSVHSVRTAVNLKYQRTLLSQPKRRRLDNPAFDFGVVETCKPETLRLRNQQRIDQVFVEARELAHLRAVVFRGVKLRRPCFSREREREIVLRKAERAYL